MRASRSCCRVAPLRAAAVLSCLVGIASAWSAQHGGSPMWHFPQWSPEGRWILASYMADGTSEIHLLPPTGGSSTRVTSSRVTEGNARWIDGGKRILFESEREGRTRFFSIKPDGTDRRPAIVDSITSVSSDGHALLFDAMRDGVGGIFATDSARRSARRLTGRLYAEQGTFSPDGRLLVYEERTSTDPHAVHKSNVVIADASGHRPRIVATGTDPSWSPDGRSILFKSWDSTTGELWISTIRWDGTGMRRLRTGVHPHWSPDGRRIAFMADGPQGRTDIWVVDQSGSGQRCLTCSIR